MDLIYCAGANPRLTVIAQNAGYLLGIRSDRTDYGFPISFVDIDYKQPDWEMHLRVVGKHAPKYATVPDLSETSVCLADIERAVHQARQLQNYCETVLIVPKVSGQIALLPSSFALGYSLPTRYGAAQYPFWELLGRRVHLLGGSPHAQMEAYRYLSCLGMVLSADGNMAQKMAIRYARFWMAGKWVAHPERGQRKTDLYLDCWLRSCTNIRQQWLSQETMVRPELSGSEGQ
jgi:hypothetical protein